MNKGPRCCDINLNPLVKALKALSEENRLKIICLLKKSEKCVCKIGEFLNLPHNLICHHLKKLTKIKILISTKKGNFTYYKINNKEYKKLLKEINCLLN